MLSPQGLSLEQCCNYFHKNTIDWCLFRLKQSHGPIVYIFTSWVCCDNSIDTEWPLPSGSSEGTLHCCGLPC